MSKAASLLERLAGLNAALQAAQAMMQDGFMPDLAGLDHRVAGICQEIEASTKDDTALRQQCLTELTGLLQSLDACRLGLHHYLMAVKP